MIVSTDAVVLRAVRYGDTSRIVTLYTRAFGRLAVIAKGARSARSKFGSSLEPLSLVRAVLYRKEGRDVHLLSQCDLLKAHARIGEDLDRLFAACAVVELVDAAVHGEEPNEQLYAALREGLEAIDSATKSPFPALYVSEIRMAGILGFQPDFTRCTACGKSPEGGGTGSARLDAARGGLLCASCGGTRTEEPAIRTVAVKALQYFCGVHDAAAGLAVVLPPGVEKEVGEVLRRYLKLHVEGLRKSRTDRVAAAVAAAQPEVRRVQ